MVTMMGSFTAVPRILNDDSTDKDVFVSECHTREDLLSRCRQELSHYPPLLPRTFCQKLMTRSQSCDSQVQDNHHIRILQWNILAQALGEKNDSFVACPPGALEWKFRRWRILEECLAYHPDILCLQEVDHFNFFRQALSQLGFLGTFFPKPDSPCYYIKGNNGPDGCAVFYNSNKFDLVSLKTRVLEVWTCQSNQVVILCIFKRKVDGTEFCVATTHLKARQGNLLSRLRNEQGKDLLDFLKLNRGKRPLIITGDFNAEPTEPVYKTMTTDNELPLESAYRSLSKTGEEPDFTTWKIREEGEICHTIDYVFFTKDLLQVENVLHLPKEEDIGQSRVPSFKYASDHFSLVSDFKLTPRRSSNAS